MDKINHFMQNLNCDNNILYELFAASTEEYAWICDPRTVTFRYPKKLIKEFNLPGEIVVKPLPYWEKLIHKDDWQKFYNTNMLLFNGDLVYHIVEFRAKNRKGEWVWLQCRGKAALDKDGKPIVIGGYISNMGRRNKIDFQTGLFSKYEFRHQIEQWLHGKTCRSFGIMILSIDDFKNIIEMHNREFGDEILREIAQKLQSAASLDVLVYHLDSDEFGLLFKETTKDVMLHFYQRIQNLFRTQQTCRGEKYFCRLSGGGCIMPNDGDSYLKLSRNAEISMHHARRSKSNSFVFFSQDILAATDFFIVLLEELRESVEHDFKGFSLAYQPQINSKTSALKGVEALLRWNSKKFPHIGPAQFIPVLEESGLIHPVGRWIVREAVKTCKKWNQYCPDITMSINVSNYQVFPDTTTEEDIFSYICHVLDEESIHKQNIILELTESNVASDIQYLIHKMQNIRSFGIQIAIDDFGTGYSSLGLLKKLPTDFVKLDKLFVDELENQDSDFDSTFIRLVTDLCHSVGIAIVQEGVETQAQLEYIKKLGPDYIQGYFFSKPRTEQEIFETYIQ